MNLREERFQAYLEAHMQDREMRLREMLGQWASELEPVVMLRASDHEILGLGTEGRTQIVVPVKGE